MSVVELLPKTVAGLPVDYHRADPEIGGIEVIIWSSAARDDGICFTVATAFEAHRVLRDLEKHVGGST